MPTGTSPSAARFCPTCKISSEDPRRRRQSWQVSASSSIPCQHPPAPTHCLVTPPFLYTYVYCVCPHAVCRRGTCASRDNTPISAPSLPNRLSCWRCSFSLYSLTSLVSSCLLSLSLCPSTASTQRPSPKMLISRNNKNHPHDMMTIN